MTRDTLVQSLLEELLDSGRSVEDVCAGHPELVDTVRESWQRLRSVRAQVDELFPSAPPGGDLLSAAAGTAPPQVPGHTVERELGRGGMGIVYRARHHALQRDVALKVMLAGPFASSRERLRFQREAELVAQLQHPNIVAIHDVGGLDSLPWYTMELVEGPSLADRLRHGPLPPPEAARLCATLARAVEFAHEHGIVHRDLKPGNILLAPDGAPKICDFGLARRIGAPGVTLTGACVGTPSYMSPEQAAGHASAVGPATDVHALGVVLYEMLAGRPPFRGATDAETTQQVLTREPPRLRNTDPRIPRDLETICLHCLHKEPRRRYDSAAQLALDLDRFTAGTPVMARRAGWLERAWARARRRPGLAAALASTALLALALLSGALWVWVDHAAVLRSAERDLTAGINHQRAARWDDARAAIDSATARLGDRTAADLRARLGAAAADLRIVAELERAALRRYLLFDGVRIVHEPATIEQDYAQLLGGFGVLDSVRAVDEVAAVLRASPVRDALVAALDTWAPLATDLVRRDRLLALLQRVDGDGGGWRDRVRNPAHWRDLPTLQELANAPAVGDQPVPLVLALVDRVHGAGGEARPLLERTLTRHPHDFWCNVVMGLLCARSRGDEAAGYFQAAIAVRPEEVSTYVYLGLVLSARGRYATGEAQMRRALALRPDDGWIHCNLGVCLARQARYREAIAAFRTATERPPEWAAPFVGLAAALAEVREMPAAMQAIREAERIDADDYAVQACLGLLHSKMGDHESALPHLERAVRADPGSADCRPRLARVLLSLGRRDEALATARTALGLPAELASMRTELGGVLRELGSMAEALRAHDEACAMPDATAADHHGRGITLAIDWQYDAAVAAFERALQYDTTDALAHGALAQALLMAGRFAAAVPAARRYAELAPDDATARAAAMLGEAERLAELAAGASAATLEETSPHDCLHLARHAASQGRRSDALRCYEAAFARAPHLADDARGGARLHAVHLALQLAADPGVDGAVRTGWHERARSWLADDLAFRRDAANRVAAPLRSLLVEYGARQRHDPGLATVRDAASLAGLAPDERNAWLDHWGTLEAWLREMAGR